MWRFCLLTGSIGAVAGLCQPVEFNRDIRPILSDKCYTCHGPDPANRKSKLRFDTEAGARQNLGGHYAIAPGDPAASELIRRITTDDKARRMPPAYAGAAKLSDREIELLRSWVEQGAKWQKHWSFLTPTRPPAPKVSNAAWVRNPIDAFVLERLDRDGLTPSPEADRAALIRRVTLDITGLPPTLPEIDAFLQDKSAAAYAKAVDRLLNSPRYGERMAARWLDAARYADTNGYQTDAERHMWRWRDWVIEAFNRNKPFDQFTVEQIAGDMLPNARLDQIIATGFNRNHRGNGEGGIIPEEYAVEYVVDRVETTATVFLGLTMTCTRCHDHKYDPLTQKEFYQFFAYFNNVPERGKAFKYGNSPPVVPAPTPDQQVQLRQLEQKLAVAEKEFAALQPELAAALRDWEKSADLKRALQWTIPDSLVGRYLEEPRTFDGTQPHVIGNVANFGFYEKFTISAWVNPSSLTGAILTRTQDVAEDEGYGLYLKDGRIQLNLILRWLDDGARVETERALEPNRWYHILASYDGSRFASGIRIYVNGEPQKLKIHLDDLNQNFASKEPLRIGGGGGPENRFRGSIRDAHVYGRALTPEEAAILAAGTPNPARRSAFYLDQEAPAHIRTAWREVGELRRQRQQILDAFPTVMVMREQPGLRDTHLLIRGAYDRPGPKVSPGVPAVLPPLAPGVPNNRLGLGRWLVDPANPLLARVTVNRFWQTFFGTGIVKTVEDFGSQGEWPTHPALLDWLATEFIQTGWDVKKTVRTIVTSAAYRQSAKVTPELLQRDPENRLLARGPRVRLPAEMVRDQALAASGLLVEKTGGPSVKPYQPAGLWKELAGGEDYPQDHGENLYRRSLYTFWKRAVAPPSMMLFDSAGREACTVRETRTNTPLQALTLMNDVTYLEASRKLAERMMTEGGATPESRVAYAFRLVTARHPAEDESRVLLASYHRSRDKFQTSRESAVRFLSQGESPRNEKLDAADLAAYASVASLILNLDETITKE